MNDSLTKDLGLAQIFQIVQIQSFKLLLRTLVWVGGGLILTSPCWFSLNNSERAKAVTLEFCSIL